MAAEAGAVAGVVADGLEAGRRCVVPVLKGGSM
jgi:hypothetical protein